MVSLVILILPELGRHTLFVHRRIVLRQIILLTHFLWCNGRLITVVFLGIVSLKGYRRSFLRISSLSYSILTFLFLCSEEVIVSL